MKLNGEKSRYVLAAVLSILVLTAICAAALMAWYQIGSDGSIQTIGVEAYMDENCTVLCENIAWGALEPGETVNVTIYLKNTEIVSFTLTMNTSNWQPVNASDYLTVTWNSTGVTLAQNEVIPATLTFTVDPAIEGIEVFSCDIFIIATET